MLFCLCFVPSSAFIGLCADTYYQELVGYRAAEPESWDDETGAPIYGAHAFQSGKDGNWYEPSYRWTVGDETSYVEPTFRQVEAGVYEVSPCTWEEDGKTPVPVYEDYSFVSDKDGRHYRRHYDWVCVPDPTAFVEPRYVQVLQGYREARELYNCWWSEEGTNVYSAVAFRSDLDDILYEPYYKWVRYDEDINENPKTYSQVLVGYKDADVICYTNGVDVSGNEIDCPVYRKTAFRSEKDGKMYEPVYEWRADEPLPGRVLKLASVSSEGYVLASKTGGVVSNTVEVTSNCVYSVCADESEGNVCYRWEVYETWQERRTVDYYVEEIQQTALIISTNGNDVTFIVLPAVSDKVGGGSYVVVCKAFNDDAEETVTWYIHVPQTYYVSETSLAETPDGRSWATAYPDIQQSVDAACSNDIIIVAPGVYLPVSVKNKSLSIISTAGADETIIEALPYSGSAYSGFGGGPCFTVEDSNHQSYGSEAGTRWGRDVCLNGFTLRNGNYSSAYSGGVGGGACGGLLLNCVVDGNRAISGGGVANATLHNCLIVGNEATTGSIVWSCELNNCTVVANGQRHDATTVYGNTDGEDWFAVDGSSVVKKSIVVGNVDAYGNEANCYLGGGKWYYSGSSYQGMFVIVSNTFVESSCTCPLADGTGNVAEDPCFMNADEKDFRLRTGSPCALLNMGAIPYDKTLDDLAQAAGDVALHWGRSADNSWTNGTSWIYASGLINGKTSFVDATTKGSGWLTFEWRVTSASGKDRFGFSLDGVGQKAIVGNCDWQRVELYVAGGETHKFAWLATKAKSGNADADCAYLRNVKWVRDAVGVAVGEALGQPGLEWSADSWRVGQDEDAAGGYYLFTDEVQDDAMAGVATVIDGPVKLAFDWRVSSEEYCDFLDLVVDGEIVQWLSGETDFEHVEITLTNGTHSVAWIYSKDGSGSTGADLAWLRDVTLTSETSGTSVPVPYAWLDKYPTIMAANNYDYDKAVVSQTHKVGSTAANPSYVWQDFVTGTNPTNASDVFRVLVAVEDGEPVVSWKPALDDDEAEKRNYTVWGKENLQDEKWTIVPRGDEAKFHFFKVSVEMK